jgi:hypothetical protein
MATTAANRAKSAPELTDQQKEALLALFQSGLQNASQMAVSEGRSKYQALTNISVPQPGSLMKDPRTGEMISKNTVVPAGETVELTETEAANLMRCGGSTGRMAPAVRPLSEKSAELPRLLPRHLSGRLRQPVTPPPDSDMPRPDPPGSSHLIVNDPNPESNEPVPGAEQEPVTGAMDIPPRHARTAAT